MNKYHAHKTEVDGFIFDSQAEARRYSELKLLETMREIGDLQLQVKYNLDVNGTNCGAYYADFEYFDSRTGKCVTEDVKSEGTRALPVYRLKKKLVKAIYGVDIVEVKA